MGKGSAGLSTEFINTNAMAGFDSCLFASIRGFLMCREVALV